MEVRRAVELWSVACGGGGGCGIPRVKFLGTIDDWETVAKRLEALAFYGCGEWVNALLPIIKKFIAAYQGEVDVKFWDMCFKMMPSFGSGGLPPGIGGNSFGKGGLPPGTVGFIFGCVGFTSGETNFCIFQDL